MSYFIFSQLFMVKLVRAISLLEIKPRFGILIKVYTFSFALNQSQVRCIGTWPLGVPGARLQTRCFKVSISRLAELTRCFVLFKFYFVKLVGSIGPLERTAILRSFAPGVTWLSSFCDSHR